MPGEAYLQRIAHCLAQGGPSVQAIGICLEGLAQTPSEALQMELLHLLNETPVAALVPARYASLSKALDDLLPNYPASFQFLMPWLQKLIKLELETLPKQASAMPDLTLSQHPRLERLILLTLKRTIVTDPELERLFCTWRRAYLFSQIPDTSQPSQLLLALIQQGANHQYIWEITPLEQQKLAAEAHQFRLVHLAYRPPIADEHVVLTDYPLLHQHLIKEPEHVLRLATQLSTPEVPVNPTQSLRTFYDAYPYPHWLELDTLAITPWAEQMQVLFPELQSQALKPPQQILIAGAGSGRQVLYYRQAEPQAQICALDLSPISLAYGQQKAQEQGLDIHINWQVGDLQRFESDRSFDLIEAVGVLHHLSDPEAGFRQLLKCLKPGGFIKVALYSQARKQFIETLKSRLNLPERVTLSSLRTLRKEVKESDLREARQLEQNIDFYTASGLQDLFCHPQERFFSLNEIQALLKNQPVNLIGFAFWDPLVYQRFQSLDPSASQSSLTDWIAFAKLYPQVFFPMYSFWFQKHA